MATIFGDYVAGFLGASRDRDSRSMNPFDVSEMNCCPRLVLSLQLAQALARLLRVTVLLRHLQQVEVRRHELIT